ncbi:inorganic pyrophosphatase 2-like [Impatiens glandulifera]|uniref:inorganic pyrophosphatase 2-like n=1 Tax=Impatiens glandulifera TaxID=253017 RepID=UPI001FB18BA7|nr:inorganic pyrophosphatase 2-like [Impatiens glandulifera]
MEKIVIVFDFDKTIIDVDSDNWVVDELSVTDVFNQLLPTMPWNTLMDSMMKELHSEGKTITNIIDVLFRVTIHPRIIPSIKKIHALGCDLRILSDANLFFIETILNHLGIKECFSEIYTNPSYVNDEGRLRIVPYHDFNSSFHGCHCCPPNMCKGKIIEKMQASMAKEGEMKKRTIIYLGDGVGDFCPSLRMTENDFVMPRRNFPVWDLICENKAIVKAEVRSWADGEELEKVLLSIINQIGVAVSKMSPRIIVL